MFRHVGLSSMLSVTIVVAAALGATGCKKQKRTGNADSPHPASGPAMKTDRVAGMSVTTSSTMGSAPPGKITPAVMTTGPIVFAGFGDPRVLARATQETGNVQLGSKGLTEAEHTEIHVCQLLATKMVNCALIPTYNGIQRTQTKLCVKQLKHAKQRKSAVNVIRKLALSKCDRLKKVFDPRKLRSKLRKHVHKVDVYTDKKMREVGAKMYRNYIGRFGTDRKLSTLVQDLCNRVTKVVKGEGLGFWPHKCATIKVDNWNARTAPGFIVFHTTMLHAMQNMAIAQIHFEKKKDLKGYLKHIYTLAGHEQKKVVLKDWPVVGCRTADAACRDKKLTDKMVHARFIGMVLAIMGHEFAHNMHHHLRRGFMRNDVMRRNYAELKLMTKQRQATFFDRLGNMVLSQTDEYEADETAIKILQAYWKQTTDKYKKETGDATMGPHPMDSVYCSIYSAAGWKYTQKNLTYDRRMIPPYLATHPYSAARLDRGLRVIIANKFAGHEMAKRAYELLVLADNIF